MQVFKWKILKRDIYKKTKEYGFGLKTLECTIVLKKLLGEGGEGAAFTIKLKNNNGQENNNLAVKEFNYLKHEGDP